MEAQFEENITADRNDQASSTVNFYFFLQIEFNLTHFEKQKQRKNIDEFDKYTLTVPSPESDGTKKIKRILSEKSFKESVEKANQELKVRIFPSETTLTYLQNGVLNSTGKNMDSFLASEPKIVKDILNKESKGI